MSAHASVSNARAVDSAVQPCPTTHYFSLVLKPADRTSDRPTWWPEVSGNPYANEAATIKLAGVAPAQTLDGGGRLRIDGLAGGSAQVQFESFYAAVEKRLADGRRFAS